MARHARGDRARGLQRRRRRGDSGGSDIHPLGTLVDANAAADAVDESARPGAAVGITLTAPELAARGAVAFALTNDANGAFKIDAATGVISIAGHVDYEEAQNLTLTARATSADHRFFAEQPFVIAVLDSPVPMPEISFPFRHANYAYPTVGVSGRIAHPEAANVSVSVRAHASINGAMFSGAIVEAVIAADGTYFARDVPIPDGRPFIVSVAASHAGGENSEHSITIGRAADLSIVDGLIVDGARDRYLLADRYSGTIVAMARNGYASSIVSGGGRGSGTPFDQPFSLALDTDRDLIYVVDNGADSVLSVDPRTGDRTVVSSGSFLVPGVGTGESLLDPKGMVYDAARRRVLVADDGRDALVAIDPATGNRTAISSNNAVFGPTLNFWDSLGLDAPRNRVIAVTTSVFEQYGIDLSTGVRTVVSDLSHDIPNPNRSFTDIFVSAARGVAYLADDFSNAVVRMDLATGVRTSITSSGLAGPLTHPVIGWGPELEWPTGVLYDETQGRLLVMEEGFADPLIEVDETTGNRTLRTNDAVGWGVNFKDPWGIALSPDGRYAYVVDPIADIVVAVDLKTGARRPIAGSPSGRGTIDTSPLAVALDAAAGKLYVVDFTLNSLYELDEASGALRTVSDAGTGTGPLLDNPYDVAVDSAARVAYVLDQHLDALFAVDLASGQRRIVASGFGSSSGLALAATHGAAYVATAGGEIFRVDLASGQRSLLSSPAVGAGPRPGDLAGVALDASRGRLFAVDRYPNRVLAIDIATGNRITVSGLSANGGVDVGGGVRFGQPRAIVVDEARQIAYVTDNGYDAVIAVDLASGYRQVVAK